MVAGAILASEPVFAANQDCAVFVTFDGGATWSRKAMNVRQCGDPWVEILPDNSVVVSVISSSRLLVFHSPDGGRSWDTTRADLGGARDHEMLAVDRTSGQFAGSVYALSLASRRVPDGLHVGVFVARSDDGGRTFRDTATHIISNVNLNPNRILVLSDGSLVVTFSDFMRNVDGFQGQGRLDRARTWLLRSTDGGRTFEPLRLASEMCGMAGFPTAALDQSNTESRDRVYVACASRTRSEILLARSLTKSLERWSDPLRVDVSSTDSLTRRIATVAVNSQGVVGLAWFEQVRAERAACQQVMFAASADGGDTFTAAMPVSSQSFCVDAPRNGSAGTRWVSGGDYFGLAAAPDGRFHVVWPDARSGVYQLRHAAVLVHAGSGHGTPQP
jgi:hypothetical protein